MTTQEKVDAMLKSLPPDMVVVDEVPADHKGYQSLVEALNEVKPTPEGRHVMYVMTPDHGDVKITWDPNKPDEVAHARRTFEQLRGERFTAHAVAEDGKPAAILNTFDAQSRALIFRPASVGG